MPRFSIVIPTRKRGRWLDRALRTCLAQTYDDFEVVVSANGDEDATEEVLARRACGRLRVVRPERPLRIHENWDFAVGHARGDYVQLLCDDDALHPRLLEIVDGVLTRFDADVVAWGLATYTYPNWPAPASGNTVTNGIYANQPYRVDARLALASAFQMRFDTPFEYPKMINCACRRQVIERIVGEVGSLFLPATPDYAAMLAMLSVVNEYLWLDAPLRLAGVGPQSIGTNAMQHGEPFQTFLKEMGYGARWAQMVPLNQFSTWNLIADTMLRTRDLIPELSGFDLDWPAYFAGCRRNIDQREALGVDWTAQRREYEAELTRRSPEFRHSVELERKRWERGPVPVSLSQLDFPLLDGPGPFYLPPLSGPADGFEDIADCAAAFDRCMSDCGADAGEVAETILAAVRSAGRPIRRVVLFGLGYHGRFLWDRLASPLGRLGIELKYYDDRLCNHLADEDRFDISRLPAAWTDTVAVVTPWEGSALTRRLEALGGQPGRDWLSWRDLVEQLQPGRKPPAARCSVTPCG